MLPNLSISALISVAVIGMHPFSVPSVRHIIVFDVSLEAEQLLTATETAKY
jgi:hypothetical protein